MMKAWASFYSFTVEFLNIADLIWLIILALRPDEQFCGTAFSRWNQTSGTVVTIVPKYLKVPLWSQQQKSQGWVAAEDSTCIYLLKPQAQSSVKKCIIFVSDEFFVFFFSFKKKKNLLTGSRAHSVHGGHGLPLIPLRVVALTGAEPIGPIETPHSVEQPVNDSNTHTDATRQHGGYQLPLVLFWIIPAEKEDTFVCFSLVF